MYFNTKALVLREVQYKDSDKILTVLTPDEGKMTVSAHRALRKNSMLSGAAQLLTYSDVTLFMNKGRISLHEAEVIESFQPIRRDIVRFTIGAYVAEVLEAVSVEGVDSSETLQLGLNTLYALGQEKWEPSLVKAVFELRTMVYNGYAPQLDGCQICGDAGSDEMMLYLEDGALFCEDCRREMPQGACAAVTRNALETMRYVLTCPSKRLFSFLPDGEYDKSVFTNAAEKYILKQLDRGFKTLDFYRGL